MPLDHLWAGWRRAYIESIAEEDNQRAAGGKVSAPREVDGAAPGSLFERILQLADDQGFVVKRSHHCSALLNAYPYTSGHLLVLPNRAAAALSELTEEEHVELWSLVRSAVAALERAYRCEGVNLGMNLGRAGGAGVPEHLHVHVLPRWLGDTNFMTAVAETRVMPEALSVTWQKLRAAWPE